MILPRAMLFDMDGTLTEPLLDFALIKREMGIGQRPILETMGEMSPAQRRAAEAVLLRHEQEAAAASKLNSGCIELLGWLGGRRIATAIITRNSLASTRTVLARHGLRFDVLMTREDGRIKPDPAPLLDACGRLGVAAGSAWMVGDGEYDIMAGMAAGVPTVWVSHGRARPFLAEPWRVVRDLTELTELLKNCLMKCES